ncbi:nucleoside ABC transporter membrane protein [Pyrobaculum islandicum DSM 4184]|uniref:Nucleoside ABC transporter membrane protein n=1 Tax=Pyrobaculum islandicum (strain DSM 4184 / JCM 9189 / GEO3) TaxID=384616 RepID=A1RT71_PYRIL|nr:ABC transporter permease [Pyrobaculum islandicum]ABL88153.1 nucleoside ABC transporter membrane protein [Pyrobaculum islandicum DSM 4184]
MRLIQRPSPSPIYYGVATLGSLAFILAIVLAFTRDVGQTINALTTIDPYYISRVFLVVNIIGISGVVSYRAGLWNIGQEGQAIVGALAAIAARDPAIALMSAPASAAAWTLLPAALRTFANVNEAVTTFLMSIVAIYVARYFVEDILRDPAKKGFIVTVEAPGLDIFSAMLTTTAVITSVMFLYKTRLGLVLRLLSSGEEIVKYAGKSPRFYSFFALILSGAIAGVGGAVEIMTRETGHYMTLQQVSTGFGLYGISAAWLGGLNPLGVVVASLYIAWLCQIAVNLKTMGFSALVANALVGIAMAWGIAGYVMHKYKIVWR